MSRSGSAMYEWVVSVSTHAATELRELLVPGRPGMVVSRAALLGLWTWRDCVKCVTSQRQLRSRPADRRIARRHRRNVLRAGDLMPCQRVLAPVTATGPPQAAEPAAAQVSS